MLMRVEQRRSVATSRNLLLRRLSPPDRALLEPHVELIELQVGSAPVSCDEVIDYVYFPETALIAIEEGCSPRSHLEVALIGHEGIIGWPALLGCERSHLNAVVQLRDGQALRISAEPLRAACQTSATLFNIIICFVQSLMIQMSCAIVSLLEHSVEQRLARWLLMHHDRIIGDQLRVRHDEIAGALHVRRATVTDALHVIEGHRLTLCRRSRILIRDRGGLEGIAGTAYGSAERAYCQLVAPFGKKSALVADLVPKLTTPAASSYLQPTVSK